jgi:predicted Zn-dependent protease
LDDLPCHGDSLPACLAAGDDIPVTNPGCTGEGRRVCVRPLGRVPPELAEDLVAYFGDEYGIDIGVMSPLAIPADYVDPARHQIDGNDLINYMSVAQPSKDATIIALTPLDLYTNDQDWWFELGERGTYDNPVAVISTFRMNIGEDGDVADYDLVFERAHKMFERYIGYLYYGFDSTDDPTSPLKRSILSVGDLDDVTDKLPVGE